MSTALSTAVAFMITRKTDGVSENKNSLAECERDFVQNETHDVKKKLLLPFQHGDSFPMTAHGIFQAIHTMRRKRLFLAVCL